MRRTLVLIAILAAPGCASHPEAPPHVDPRWWSGVWVLDQPRLAAEAATLPPDARDLARDLVRGLGADWRLELADGRMRRSLGAERTDVPVDVVTVTAERVVLHAPTGDLTLARAADGARLDALPIRRP